MRKRKKITVGITAALALTACDRDFAGESSSKSKAANIIEVSTDLNSTESNYSDALDQIEARRVSAQQIDYKSWCRSWGIDCSDNPVVNIPNPKKIWSHHQWRSLFNIVAAMLNSKSQINIYSKDIHDQRYTQMIELLGITELGEIFKEILIKYEFKSLRVGNGKIQWNSVNPFFLETPSGMLIDFEKQVTVSISSNATVVFNGIVFHGNGYKSDRLQKLQFLGSNMTSWTGDNIEVTKVPISHAFENILGIDFANYDSPPLPEEFSDKISMLAVLKNWAEENGTKISLNQNSLQIIKDNVVSLVDGPNNGNSVKSFLAKITSIQTPSSNGYDFEAKSSSNFSCTMGKESEIIFSSHFGVKNVENINDSLQVKLFGIKARKTKGVFRRAINLSNLTISKDLIEIHNVPVIGTFKINLTRTKEQNHKIICK